MNAKKIVIESFYKEVWMKLAEFLEVPLPNYWEYLVEWIRM